MPTRLQLAPGKIARDFGGAFVPEIVNRTCVLSPVKTLKVSPFAIKDNFIAYASPESTFAVTKSFLDGAKESILIGIYDFTAGYVKELLFKAMQRGVKVSLMLDLDNRSGETPLFNDLVKHGCDGVPAPSCASKHAHFFASSHEKVIVIDDTWTLVQSGNYSDASIPLNEKDGGDKNDFTFGNRDMGVAVRSKSLATFFRKVLRADMKLELDATGIEAAGGMADLAAIEAFGAKPTAPAPTLFKSKSFKPKKSIRVTPILSPDNYMKVVPDFLKSATQSIDIEQQYIRPRQPLIQQLLEAIRQARTNHPNLKVRIVLARPIVLAPKKGQKAKENKDISDIKSLSQFGLKVGTHIRLLSPKHFVHCHNKLIIVDKKSVLVSSQNWSDFAVSKNREAGLLLEYPDIANYYADIFQVDWDTGVKTLTVSKEPLFTPETFATGKVVRLNWGDYAEV
jgi:phosphatidylserine/phosphatidylglycerophosphate/cardiolipin synthase-like enzyme